MTEMEELFDNTTYKYFYDRREIMSGQKRQVHAPFDINDFSKLF